MSASDFDSLNSAVEFYYADTLTTREKCNFS